MATYIRPDATLPAIAENGGRADMSPTEIGQGWSTTSQTRPPAERFNTRDFLNSSAVKYLCRLGVAEYSPAESYQGLGMCIGSDGSVYWNLAPSTGINPVGDVTGHWERMPCRVHDAQNLINAMIAGLGFLTYALADARYMQLGTAPTWDQVRAEFATFAWVQANFPTFQWVLDQLANYATNANAQAWANNAQNAATGYTDWRLGDVQGYLQGQIDQHSGQIGDLYNRANNADAGIAAVNNRVNGLMPTTGSGWLQLPNGVIQQWQQYSNDSGAAELTRFLYFPRPFPSACWNVSLTTGFQGTGQGNNMMMYQVYQSWNASGVSVYRARSGSNNNTITFPIVFATGI
jgi:hypothetical protein